MSGRCRSCNTVMTEEELCFKYPDGDYADMCFRCIGLSEEGEEDFFDLEFDENAED